MALAIGTAGPLVWKTRMLNEMGRGALAKDSSCRLGATFARIRERDLVPVVGITNRDTQL